MSDPWTEIEEYARSKKQAQEQEQRAKETDERFTNLEAKLDTLADGVTKLVESSSERRPPAEEEGGGAAATGDGERTPKKPEPVPDPEPILPVETVTRGTVPRIYTGDDEPAEVEYIDGPSGETRKRPGRKKGHPTLIVVEPYQEPVAPGSEEEVA